jgi:hypothetical protein
LNIYKSKTEKGGRQTMQTPPGIAEFCAATWGCNIDLAASAANKKFHYYFSDVMPNGAWGPDPNWVSDGYRGNALIDSWVPHAGWSALQAAVGFCNPPYANLTPWLKKASEQALAGFTSVFLIPTFNGDEWARLVYIWAREIIFIEGRINFIRESDGLPLKGNGRGSMLCVFGPRTAQHPAFGYVSREILMP